MLIHNMSSNTFGGQLRGKHGYANNTPHTCNQTHEHVLSLQMLRDRLTRCRLGINRKRAAAALLQLLFSALTEGRRDQVYVASLMLTSYNIGITAVSLYRSHMVHVRFLSCLRNVSRSAFNPACEMTPLEYFSTIL